MTAPRKLSSVIRLITVGAILTLAAYWAGARWGQRQPINVGAGASTSAEKINAAGSPALASPLTEDESRTVNIYRQVSPAVANIITQAVEYDFFMNAVPVEGAGSGFVIDPKGYVLTNYHVVEGAEKIEVALGDRNHYPAKFIGADERNDVALLKIDPKGAMLTAVPLGDSSNLQVGQKVIAIGNPFGFSSTLTTGVVSALGRTVQTGEKTFIDQAIQTDAAINRGNSGGPLLNSHGEVIGINSAIYTPSGTTAGIGFAIPISMAKEIAHDLMTDGRVHRADLGLGATIDLWPGLAQALDLPVSQGLLVERLPANSAAAHAGLKGGTRAVMAGLQRLIIGGDVIVAIDGKPVNSSLDVNIATNHKKPGESVTLTIYRANTKMEIPVTLNEN
jgi:S1-C subfamily serine protease